MNKDTNIFVHEAVQRTVVVVDLVRYSEIVKSLQLGQKLGANATLLVNNQIQALIRDALNACSAKPDCFVKSTGDGGILQFENPTVAEHFAAALHRLSFEHHCESSTNPYEWRSFRAGIFTGEVVLSLDEIAGAIVGFATRLETAAEPGEILIDSNSWAQLTPADQALYGAEEVLKVKAHDPVFVVHRRRVVASPQWQDGTISPGIPKYLNKAVSWPFESWKRKKNWWIASGAILLLAALVIGVVAFRHGLNSRAIKKARGHSEKGDALFNKNKFNEAEAEYRKAIEFDPKTAHYYFKLASVISFNRSNSLEGQTELIRGEKVARELILSDPQNAAHHHALGLVLSEQTRYLEAEAAFREAIRLNPTNPEYRHDFAFFNLFAQDKLYEAETEVREAIRLKPDFDYYDSLGQILRAIGNYVEAEVEARKAIELNPDPYWVYEHLAEILYLQEKCAPAFEAYKNALTRYSKRAFSENGLGNVYFSQGRHAEAEVKYRRAIELDPRYPAFHNNLGDLLSALGRTNEAKSKYESAEAAHRELIRLFPNDPLRHVDLGDFLTYHERYDDAKAEYETAISLAPGQGSYHAILGDLLASLNKHDEAKFEFKKAESVFRQQVKQHPKEAGYHFDLGRVLYRLRRDPESRLEFEMAAALSGESPSYYVVLANFYYDRNDYINSILYHRKAVSLRPDNADYRSFLGVALFAMAEYEDAKSEHRRAHELNPEEANHLNNLGDCYLRLNQYPQAEQAYQKAVELNPSNSLYRNNLAHVLYAQRQYEKALTESRKAVELGPTVSLYWDNLASTLSTLRMFEEAREANRKANELKKSSTSTRSFQCR